MLTRNGGGFLNKMHILMCSSLLCFSVDVNFCFLDLFHSLGSSVHHNQVLHFRKFDFQKQFLFSTENEFCCVSKVQVSLYFPKCNFRLLKVKIASIDFRKCKT